MLLSIAARVLRCVFCCKNWGQSWYQVKFVTVLLLWLLSCFSLSALWFSSAAVSTFSLLSPSCTHNHNAQTHMNNGSGEEIAADWQQRWFPTTIQNSLREWGGEREREGERGGPTLAYQTEALWWEKKVWRRSGEDWKRLMFKQQRRRNESASKHGFTMIWTLSSFCFFFFQTKGKKGEQVKDWSCGCNYWLASQTLSHLCGDDTHAIFPPSSQFAYICTLVNKDLCLW